MQDNRKKKKSVGQESWLLALNTNECHLRSLPFEIIPCYLTAAKYKTKLTNEWQTHVTSSESQERGATLARSRPPSKRVQLSNFFYLDQYDTELSPLRVH